MFTIQLFSRALHLWKLHGPSLLLFHVSHSLIYSSFKFLYIISIHAGFSPPCLYNSSCLLISHTVSLFHTPVYSLWNIFCSFMLSARCLPSGIFFSCLFSVFFPTSLIFWRCLLKHKVWCEEALPEVCRGHVLPYLHIYYHSVVSCALGQYGILDVWVL